MSEQHPLTIWRKKKGMTQAELGDLLGVQDAAITKWEKGRVPAERVLKVSEVTGLSPTVLRPDIYPREKFARVRA